MTILELKNQLENESIPQYMYSLLSGGFPNEAYCLTERNGMWEVYYSERGNKRGQKQFSTENDACEYFYKKVKKYASQK